MKKLSKRIHNKKILEIGSGKPTNGKYLFSVKRYFDETNEFVQSDLNPHYGHKTVDITNMNEENVYDVILCLNVLEHVFEIQVSIDNLHKALKPEGVVVIMVPGAYPLHDEPHDYWRFTEHSLRKLLKNYSKVTLKYTGPRQFPFGYYVEAVK